MWQQQEFERRQPREADLVEPAVAATAVVVVVVLQQFLRVR